MPFFKTLLAGMLAVMVIAMTACQSTGPVSTRPIGVQPNTNSEVSQQEASAAYLLGNGDKVRITVYGQPDLSGEFEVDGTGAISLPLVGQVQAIGLSTPQLEAKIVSMLDGDYILNPRVSAEVTNYRPFYILGEVGRPGEYPYTSGLTVLNAVAAAGGFTYRANKKVIFIKSVESHAEEAFELNTSTMVKPGDTLRVGERIF